MVHPQLKCRVYIRKEVDIEKFCHQLLNCPNTEEHINTGSFHELPDLLVVENLTDCDTLVPSKQFCALPANGNHVKPSRYNECHANGTHFATTTKYWPKEAVLRINSENCHSGFTHLIFDDGDNKGKSFTVHDLRWTGNLEVCWSRTMLGKSEKIWKLFENLETWKRISSYFEGFTLDWVDAIHCPVWPEAADEWKCRRRFHRWPSPELIESVISNGCHLISKSHDRKRENISEWRFSFSAAETQLIHTWSYGQKLIYHILRIVKKDVLRTCGGKDHSNLTTYNFKTLMLWACEEKPAEFWERRNLKTSLEELLCTMIEWLIEKVCRNYFIPSNNMWDNLPSGHHFDLEVQNILLSVENVQEYISSTAHLQEESVKKEKCELVLIVPNKLFIILQSRFLRSRVLDPDLPGYPRFMPSNALEETEYFTSKIRNLYRALCIHRLIVSEALETKLENELVEEVLECFGRCKQETFEGFTHIPYSPFDSFHDMHRIVVQTPIGAKQTGDRRTSTGYIAELETILNSFFQRLNDDIENPFWFLYCAYEANFHYTAFERRSQQVKRKHWLKALQLCNTGLLKADKLKAKYTYFIDQNHRLFKVIINNDFAEIFDRYINAVLKSNCGVFGEHGTPEYVIHFTIENFLRYVRIQCMRKLNIVHNEELEIRYVEKSVERIPLRMVLCDALRMSSNRSSNWRRRHTCTSTHHM